jgi:hypothetical protein
MLRVDPQMLDRLGEIETDLHARRQRAEKEGWLGEIEGIDLPSANARKPYDSGASRWSKSAYRHDEENRNEVPQSAHADRSSSSSSPASVQKREKTQHLAPSRRPISACRSSQGH